MGTVLRYFSGKSIKTIVLGKRMVCFGSAPQNDVRLEDSALDDLAAKIESVKGTFFLEAVQRGRVAHNGKKIRRVELAPGDRIEVGDHIFTVDQSDEEIGAAHPAAHDKQFTALKKFTEIVGSERDMEPVLYRLMDHLLTALHGSEAFIFKLDTDGKPQVFVTTEKNSGTDRFSDTVVQRVIREKKGLYVSNAMADPAFSDSSSIADLKLASVLCSPIVMAGRLLGIVYIGARGSAVSYTESDLEMLSVYASISGMLIGHVEYIRQQNAAISRLTGHVAEEGFIAESRAMQYVVGAVKIVAATDITVLLEGPTGSGKNHVAELIHKKSSRAGKPFMVVNCSSLSGELLESELFGHKKGSFTGAISDNQGIFAAARGGTLLLDEIGELDPAIQAKLLRVLETNTVRPLGSAHEMPVNVRVICATNRDLLAMTGKGTFRSDLYYRISQYGIKVPSLAERGEDVELLAYFFLEKYKASYPSKEIVDFYPETLTFIRTNEWPGNIRELSNTIHRAILSCDEPLLSFTPASTDPADTRIDFEGATRSFQKDLIAKAVKRTGGNKEEAAKLLGLSRSTFFRYHASLSQDSIR